MPNTGKGVYVDLRVKDGGKGEPARQKQYREEAARDMVESLGPRKKKKEEGSQNSLAAHPGHPRMGTGENAQEYLLIMPFMR